LGEAGCSQLEVPADEFPVELAARVRAIDLCQAATFWRASGEPGQAGCSWQAGAGAAAAAEVAAQVAAERAPAGMGKDWTRIAVALAAAAAHSPACVGPLVEAGGDEDELLEVCWRSCLLAAFIWAQLGSGWPVGIWGSWRCLFVAALALVCICDCCCC